MKEKFLEAVQNSSSKSDICKILGWPINGCSFRKITKYIDEFDADTSHFDGGRSKNIKYKTIKKSCPVCNNEFETKGGHKKERQTCSRACSNTFFRTKTGITKFGTIYRLACFTHYPHVCAFCEWDKVLDVHHIDGNNKNDNLENLIPLCPNHHRLTIMNIYKDEIQNLILEWKRNNP